jgi:3-hydroxyacyl-CoA dehydrogenase
MRVAILGAGVMGVNIARVLANGESTVALCSRTQATLDRARGALATSGTPAVSFHTSIHEAADGADVVVESVPESLELKRTVLRESQRAAATGAVIATNTSSLPLRELAAQLDDPSRFLGWHWFNPAHLIPLVEVVPSELTDASVVEWSLSTLRAAGKRPALAPAIDGFLVNRLQYALIREALTLVEQGLTTPEQVDAAITDCLGLRWAAIGPMRSTDLAGIRTAVAVARQLYPQLSNVHDPQAVLTDLEETGRLGALSGRGFFDYGDGADPYTERDRRLAAVLRALAEAP